jgi:hypothetical protein
MLNFESTGKLLIPAVISSYGGRVPVSSSYSELSYPQHCADSNNQLDD